MATMFRPISSGARFEIIAATWGGIVPALVLMATNTQPLGLRVALAVLAFAFGGFLAGVRATGRRPLHGIVGAIIGIVIYLVFIGLTRVASAVGIGPDGFSVAPSGPGRFALLSVAGIAASALAARAVGVLLGSAGATRLGS